MLVRPFVSIVLAGLVGASCARDTRKLIGPWQPIDAGERVPALLSRSTRVFERNEDAKWTPESSFDFPVDPVVAIAVRAGHADVMFLGETHLDRATHELERAVLCALADPSLDRENGHLPKRQVVLAMEMFERDVQPALDDYLAGRIDEGVFRHRARVWGNYTSDYRPLIEDAKAYGIPVIASNIPAELRRKLSREGQKAYDALTPEEKAFVPRTLIENPPEYWKRVENVTRGHGALGMGGGSANESRLFDGQNLWDNTMAESCADALDKYPGALVLHVNGGFHTDRWQGTAWQLKQRKPDARIVTVEIEATTDVAGVDLTGDEPTSDLRVFVEARARSESDGAAAVNVTREHEFRLDSATSWITSPLFVWLCDDGETAQEAIDAWRPVIGLDAMILALEPSYPYLGDDGIRGARWFFPGSVSEGAGLGLSALERAVAEAIDSENVAGRHAIDPARIVIAGEGAGATIAIYAARYTDDLAAKFVAFAPVAADDFGLMTLPLPLRPRTPRRSLAIHDRAPDEFWKEFAADDGELRLATTLVPFADDAIAREQAQIDAVRAALGLAPAKPSAIADEILRVTPQHARAQRLARTLARTVRKNDRGAMPSLDITPEAFAEFSYLPQSSGAFGGTTIVVLDDDASDAAFAAWKKLEDPDILQKRSKFHRLRIAQGTGERSPKAVIEKLRTENAQRRDFLIVPATFCAEPARLRELRERIGPLGDTLRLEFLPGLGDRLAVLNPKARS